MNHDHKLYQDIQAFVLLGFLGTAACFLNVKIPHTEALIDGRFIFGFVGFAVLHRTWLAFALACLLSIPYQSDIFFLTGFFGNLGYALPELLIIRGVYKRFLHRLDNIWVFGWIWFCLIMVLYQVFHTPVIWGVISAMDNRPVLSGIIQGFQSQPYFVESLIVALISGSVMAVLKTNEDLRQNQARLDHINRILYAIRRVNQLITTEDNPDRLIRKIAEHLTQKTGFNSAWIVLSAENGKPVFRSRHAGKEECFLEAVSALENRNILPNLRQVADFLQNGPDHGDTSVKTEAGGGKNGKSLFRETEGIHPEIRIFPCVKCKANAYHEKNRCTIYMKTLEYEKKIYGFIAVSLQSFSAFYPAWEKNHENGEKQEEEKLFSDVAGDLSFALHKMEEAEALRQNTEDLRRAQSVAQVGSWRFDLQKGVVIASDEARKIYGIDTRIWAVQEMQNIPLPEHRQTLDAALKGLVETGRPFDVEFLIKRPKDGRIRHIHSIAEYDQKRQMVIGTIQDITRKKQAEEAIRIHEENLKSLFNAINESVGLIDKNGILIAANETFARRLGKTVEEILGTRVFDHVQMEVKENRKRIIEEVIRTGEHAIFEDAHFGRWLHHRIYPIADKKGRVDRLAVYAMNITETKKQEAERKKFEKELLRRNQFIETILDNLPIGLAVNYIDEGKATYINKKFEEIYGWPKEELENIERFFTRIYPDPEYREMIRTRIMTDIESGDPEKMQWDGIGITTQKGEKRIISAKNIPLYEQNFMISTVQDTTESKKLQERLQQAQKMEAIGNLAGGIAHDFNNILYPIIGMAELLMDDLPKGSIQYENAEEILKAGVRASDLVKQILAFSRQSEQKRAPLAVQLVVKEVLRLSRSTIPTDIEITQDIQPDCGKILADPTQIHQIAMNLITNAFHAVENTGGTISVCLQETQISQEDHPEIPLEPGKYLKFSVTDTGTGIEPEIREKIFEPYFTTKNPGRGTGLGLAVVYGIVKEYHGDIRVYSEAGRGTAFHVFLPVVKETKEQEAFAPAAAAITGRERILLVDDEDPIVRLETDMLTKLGYNVTPFTDSEKALEAFRKNPEGFDLLITDMSMPKMTGVHLAKQVISLRPGMPVILCTGFSERINRDTALSMGIRELVIKPVVRMEMAKTVRRILDLPKNRK